MATRMAGDALNEQTQAAQGAQQVVQNQSKNRFDYSTGEFEHKPRDYEAISTGVANRALERADQRDLGELEALQKSVDQTPLYWKSRSDVQTGDYLGDIWNFKIPNYKMPDPLKESSAPNISGLASQYMSRIGSIKPKF